ncbi:TPA: GTPase HflX [Candidatus Bathyarchaeota archaeon]|nr:GTPase HflX [Candidatus Bathyarchaeota archaeon]
MDELKSLAEAAGYTVIGEIEQVRRADPRYQIGEGKAEEIAKLVSNLNVERVIFGNDLKPVQAYNLAKLLGIEVIDRFQLILEIFVRRASTKEAKLQIALAKLKYELARAKEKVRLAKMGEQPGFSGLGKYQVDVYYEMIRRRIKSIERKLKKIRKTRALHRRHRKKLGFPLVSLAGYTNSGKSTLFNSLTSENVPTDCEVFTTLSTTVRLANLGENEILITDTVGFIDNLPISLIEAFRSTLEEMVYSDLILLVIDISDPIQEIKRKVGCCLDTIKQIGAARLPIIAALNKIDLLNDSELDKKLSLITKWVPNPVPISALYKINLELLKDEIQKHIQFSLGIPATIRII